MPNMNAWFTLSELCLPFYTFLFPSSCSCCKWVTRLWFPVLLLPLLMICCKLLKQQHFHTHMTVRPVVVYLEIFLVFRTLWSYATSHRDFMWQQLITLDRFYQGQTLLFCVRLCIPQSSLNYPDFNRHNNSVIPKHLRLASRWFRIMVLLPFFIFMQYVSIIFILMCITLWKFVYWLYIINDI